MGINASKIPDKYKGCLISVGWFVYWVAQLRAWNGARGHLVDRSSHPIIVDIREFRRWLEAQSPSLKMQGEQDHP